MKKIIILLLIPILTADVWAKGAGTSGAIVLDQLASIRASGMADAYTAVGGEIGAAYYNPANLITIADKQVSCAYQSGIAEDRAMSIGYGHPTPLETFSVSFLYYTAGDIDLLDIYGNERTVVAEKDYLIVLGYAHKLIPMFPMGINIKWLSSTLVDEETARAFAADLGILYNPPVQGFSIGLAVRNLGQKLTYIEEGDFLPLIASAGIAYRHSLGNQNILFSVDAPYRVYDAILTPAVGCEYDWEKKLQLRAGYKFNSDDTGLTLGMGIGIQHYTIHYAFGMSDELNSSHRVSFDVKF